MCLYQKPKEFNQHMEEIDGNCLLLLTKLLASQGRNTEDSVGFKTRNCILCGF